MNVLIVHAHPDPASFNTALNDRVGAHPPHGPGGEGRPSRPAGR
ncbi:hypothetical protein [Streptomyces sp. NPDC005989]